MAQVRLENLIKHYGKVKAVDEINLEIQDNEFVVFLGPSGCGKSTFLRCLNRLEKADNGHILIDGIDVLDPKTNINKLRAEVGMVFQSFNLFPHKNVFENIALAQKVVRKRSKDDAAEKAGSDRIKVLAEALDAATSQYLESNKSPSRKVMELDNRGSHFYNVSDTPA